MLYGESSLFNQVRARAVDHLINNQENYEAFLANEEEGSIADFILSLSTNREWADNLAIQVVADAYDTTIDIVSDNAVHSHLAIPLSGNGGRLMVLGYIDQLHYMATEPDFPFSTLTWGGTFEGVKLMNSCPLDGPLSWLMIAIELLPKLKSFVEAKKLSKVLEVLDLFQKSQGCAGKKFWFENIAGKEISKGNMFGSETEQFFEPLSRSDLSRISYNKSCFGNCKSTTIKKNTLTLKQDNLLTFDERVQNADKPVEEKCPKCSGETMISLNQPPPLVYFPQEAFKGEYEIPTVLTINGVVYILALITIFSSLKKHFSGYFRFNQNY